METKIHWAGGVSFIGETAEGHKVVMDGAPEGDSVGLLFGARVGCSEGDALGIGETLGD